jgi:hypothetical protein
VVVEALKVPKLALRVVLAVVAARAHPVLLAVLGQQVKVIMVVLVLLVLILEQAVVAVLALLVLPVQAVYLARVVLALHHQFPVRLSLMLVVAAVEVLTALQMARVVLAAAVLVVFLAAETQLRARQIQEAAGVVVLTVVVQLAAMVALVLSSLAMQDRSAVQAAR